MISRGILRGIRSYSTSGGAGDSASFLSDLMKRVDTLAARTNALKAKQDLEKESKLAKGNSKAGTQKAKTINKPSKASAARQSKIEVQDHPLGKSGFRNNGQSRLRKPDDQGSARGPRRDNQNSSEKRSFQPRDGNQQTNFKPRNDNNGPRTAGTERTGFNKFEKKSDEAGSNTRQFTPRPRQTSPRSFDSVPRERRFERSESRPRNTDSRPRGTDARAPRRTGPASGNRTGARSFANRNADSRGAASAVTQVTGKEIQPMPYQPSVNGDTFFYGKPASATFSVTSRVSAVAKEILLKSNYPYKLPKEIIESVKPGISGNRFLLQKNWNLNVRYQPFEARMKEVVKGNVEQLVTPATPGSEGVEATTKRAAETIIQNGTYAHAQKQVVVDVASGVVSPKSLLQGAHWNK